MAKKIDEALISKPILKKTQNMNAKKGQNTKQITKLIILKEGLKAICSSLFIFVWLSFFIVIIIVIKTLTLFKHKTY